MKHRALGVVVFLIAGCDGGSEGLDASTQDVIDVTPGPDVSCVGVDCPGNDAVVFMNLGCGSANIVDAALTGVCAPTDGGNPFMCSESTTGIFGSDPFKDCAQTFFRTANVGDCGLTVTFADGFAYATNISITRAPPDLCCAGMFTETPNPVDVSDPDAGCSDAGAGD